MIMKKNRLLLFIAVVVLSLHVFAQKNYKLLSPNNNLEMNIAIGNTIEYTIREAGYMILDKSSISMTLSNGVSWGEKSRIKKVKKRSVNRKLLSPMYKRKEVDDVYNELHIEFKEGFSLIFRAYDEGVAYRFVSEQDKPFIVKNEQAIFNFNTDNFAYIPYVYGKHTNVEAQFFNSFENVYDYSRLSEWKANYLSFLPIVIETAKGSKVCITEADLKSYPGMFLSPSSNKKALEGVFSNYPQKMKQGGYNAIQEIVLSRYPYIAKYEHGSVDFPWRIIVIAQDDYQLADNDMVYKLSTPPAQEDDFSWVKPGKVAWEWWNNWNLYNVDFETGVNNETYKYYIDFASKYGIEYVILDDGWSMSRRADLFDVVPEIDLPQLVNYAKSKNVGIILWAGYYAFNKDMESVCKHYSRMGIKGFKVDFMDRDDQLMVDFHYNAAKITAKYNMLIDFHGTYKPTGLNRTFPNVVNNEGVYGLEQLKFEHKVVDLVTYDVTFPFIRMLAGQVDYTQGAMRNATKDNFRAVMAEPMSQGTRCRQLAQYIIFESPLNMMCDSPSNYIAEDECTRFIVDVPTVWDNTLALNGKIGEYITIARKKDNVWYVGSMTNWDKRTLEIDLSFLEDGNYQAEVFQDGINAHKIARDYKKKIIDIPQNKKVKISMAPGGGYAMKITKK